MEPNIVDGLTDQLTNLNRVSITIKPFLLSLSLAAKVVHLTHSVKPFSRRPSKSESSEASSSDDNSDQSVRLLLLHIPGRCLLLLLCMRFFFVSTIKPF